MDTDLSGKIALITGSTKGIGFAIAKGLHEAGATVVVNGRDQDRVDETIERLGGGDRVRGIAADVATAKGCQAIGEAVPSVDILVNNAGAYVLEPVFEIPDSEWERLLALNLMSGVRLSRNYGPAMAADGWGRIIFVSSEAAIDIPPEMVHYGTTKLAQLGVARGLAETLSGTGVTVNSVLPGPTRSEGLEAVLETMVGNGAGDIDEAAQLLIETQRPTSLLGRMSTPEEVANLVVYLASPAASATVGAAVRVDGGVVRSVI